MTSSSSSSTAACDEPKDRQRLLYYYDISKCVSFVESGKFQNATLQFPDELIPDAAAVASLIEEKAAVRTYILADTSYGSCCVDQVAAQHVNADCLIHFGQATLTDPGLKIPVLYVFGKEPIDVDDCISNFRHLFPHPMTSLLLLSDILYYHAQDQLFEKLKCDYTNLISAEIDCGLTASCSCKSTATKTTSTLIKHFGRSFNLPEEKSLRDYAVFYIGSEGPVLINFMMTLNQCSFYSYNPSTREGRQETLNVNRALMRRYYLIQKAKDANVVGIVVGTLGVANYLGILDRMKMIIKKAGKKSYTFVVGKLNPAKLANFMEIDVYVLIAAPEESLVDSKDFYRPILTPYEMEIACLKNREWTGDYVTDFRELLPGAAFHVEPESSEVTEPEYSLITGNLRSLNIASDDEGLKTGGGDSKEIVKRSPLHVATVQGSSGGQFLSSRSWQGLEPRLGETDDVKVKSGRRGIAIAYENEPKNN